MKLSKRLELLEVEMELIKDNIQRIKDYQFTYKKSDWKPYKSSVFGELRHRLIAFKQSSTTICKHSTTNLFD